MKGDPRPICPKCGRRIDQYLFYRKRKRVYVVAVHYKNDAEEYRRCHLGPLDGYVRGPAGGVRLKPAKNVFDQIENYIEVIKTITDKLVNAVEETGSRVALRSLASYLRLKAAELQIKAEALELQAKAQAKAGSRTQQPN